MKPGELEITLFGRTVVLSEDIDLDVIAMHPETWYKIEKIAYRNSVVVEISAPIKLEDSGLK